MFNDRFRSGRAMLCALIALFFTTLGFGAAAAQPSPARAKSRPRRPASPPTASVWRWSATAPTWC